MTNRKRLALIAVLSLLALVTAIGLFRPNGIAFFLLLLNNNKGGTWEDDPDNWCRAFNAKKPEDINIIHSKYWKSNHFTEEHMYFFEVQASAEWKNTFLKQHNLEQISPSAAPSFNNGHVEFTPIWFVPDPVNAYDVWGSSGGSGMVWINRNNGHIYFYEAIF